LGVGRIIGQRDQGMGVDLYCRDPAHCAAFGPRQLLHRSFTYSLS
jgi:hypothetical protein